MNRCVFVYRECKVKELCVCNPNCCKVIVVCLYIVSVK